MDLGKRQSVAHESAMIGGGSNRIQQRMDPSPATASDASTTTGSRQDELGGARIRVTHRHDGERSRREEIGSWRLVHVDV